MAPTRMPRWRPAAATVSKITTPSGGAGPRKLLPQQAQRPFSHSASAWWKPALTVKQVLLGVQTLLDDPNVSDPAQEEPYRIFMQDKAQYDRRVRAQISMFRC